MPAGRNLGHRACLDGVRGVAILAVVAAHTERFRSPAAFVAVMLFFVLSGFLITCLLLEEWERRGTFSLRRFYVRRVLRLLPALAVMLLVMVVYHWLNSPRPVARAVSVDALVAFFYSSNWALAYGFHQPNLFGHAWSLSIEEQFYLIWPPLLLLLLRFTRFPKSTLNWVVLGVALVAIARVLLVVSGSNFHRFFYGTDMRADCLLLGCAGALTFNSGMLATVAQHSLQRFLLKAAAYGSLAGLVLLGAYSAFSWQFDVCVVYLLIPIFGTFLLLGLILESTVTDNIDVNCCRRRRKESLINGVGRIRSNWIRDSSRRLLQSFGRKFGSSRAQEGHGFLARVFEMRWLSYIGQISYGIYLWHYPIFSEVQTRHWPARKELAIEFLLTTVAVLASYYLLERPLLRLKKRFQGEK